MKTEELGMLGWLNFRRYFDFSKARWLGTIAGFLIICAVFLLAVIALIALVQLFGSLIGFGPFASDPNGSAIRNIGLLLVAVIGAPFLVWRSVVAQKQVDVAEQGQITDRINKAIEGLGSEKTVRKIIEIPRYQKENSEWKRDKEDRLVPALRPDGIPLIDREIYEHTLPNLEVRIGAIYALERIAQDSSRDHIQIMEILCAYIRENAPVATLEPTEIPFDRPVPRIDIQTAVTVIGRRSLIQIEQEWKQEFRLDLRKTDLSGVSFINGNFSAALFIGSRIEAAFFRKTKLVGTHFDSALLNHSDFFNAELKGTVFDRAIINRPIPISDGMVESIHMGEIYGISVAGADISAIDYIGEPNQTNLVFGTEDTRLSSNLESDRNQYKKQKNRIRILRRNGDTVKANNLETELLKKNFSVWFPHKYEDMARGHFYLEFLDKLGLKGWPYQ